MCRRQMKFINFWNEMFRKQLFPAHRPHAPPNTHNLLNQWCRFINWLWQSVSMHVCGRQAPQTAAGVRARVCVTPQERLKSKSEVRNPEGLLKGRFPPFRPHSGEWDARGWYLRGTPQNSKQCLLIAPTFNRAQLSGKTVTRNARGIQPLSNQVNYNFAMHAECNAFELLAVTSIVIVSNL